MVLYYIHTKRLIMGDNNSNISYMYTIRWFRFVNCSFLAMRHNGRKKHETYEHPKVRTKDINIFIALLIKQYHEVTVYRCKQTTFSRKQRNIARSPNCRYNIKYEPYTHKRGSKRIDFVFCTKLINPIHQKCGILPFDTVTVSDHRSIYLDINLFDFLNHNCF